MPGPKPMSLDRIWARGRREGDCLIWTGAQVRGYGVIRRSGRSLYVHRVAWELTYEAAASGLVVLHACDRPACFEPAHLRLGTQADNIADAASKARTSWGEGRTNHKVALEDVREMRRLHAQGVTADALAKVYPIGARTIRKILSGKNWRHDTIPVMRS